jgi:hypothetical protein
LSPALARTASSTECDSNNILRRPAYYCRVNAVTASAAYVKLEDGAPWAGAQPNPISPESVANPQNLSNERNHFA